MDIILFVIDTLIVLLYITLIAFITPITMKFLKRRNFDIFIQLLPVCFIVFVSSILISIGLGGFKEMVFFQITSIVSLILLGFLLFLTMAMRVLWKDKYDRLVERILSFREKNERSFSLK
ncbi:hypothetical protein MHZ92_06500 [Sporosarcina sp. ACRSL]|uniref:hypothetical protein n=1 Tax=Sporosarcina sp. ACRSL TaxID=2918215 RepID=UPI001EF4E2A4|nr:hypothetical protein [Sporosarcina sp. ACRSL]MCG7343776.1 hypothetical protein [Sporosarcina sp. ACRSL]